MNNSKSNLAKCLRDYAEIYIHLSNHTKDGRVPDLLLVAADTIEELSSKLERYETKIKTDNIYEILTDRLKQKKDELREKQYQFSIMCENEMQSGTFERNAISDLVVMQQLKSEIGEMEHWEMLLKSQMK